jgi:amino acid transporter
MGLSGNVYSEIITTVRAAGFDPTPAVSMIDTWYCVPIFAFVYIWVGWVSYVFGEVRKAEQVRNQIFMLMGGTIFAAIIAMTTIYGVMNGAIGREFYNAAIIADFEGISPLPVAPMFAVFISALHVANPAIMLWILLSLNFWWIGWVGTLTLEATRCMFACSFDRLLPAWIAEVRTKFRVPLNAITLSFITNIIFALLFNYIPEFGGFWLNVVMWGMYVQMTTVFAAVIWPWRRKESFKVSTASRYKWLMVVTGLIYVIFSLVILIMYAVPPYGEWYGTANIPSYLWLIGMAAAHYIVYLIYKYKRKQEGIDFDLIYKEVPVE